MVRQTRPRIGVMGPSQCSAHAAALARETGSLIAEAGAVLICGGGGGVMQEAAAGASAAGGLTVGILPGSLAEEANKFVDIPIVTGLGNARNVINVLTSQAIIAIQGAYGTLSEIALALKCGTPVIALESWDLKPPGGGAVKEIIHARTPAEAVAAALECARKKSK